jgi:hypothetical protein
MVRNRIVIPYSFFSLILLDNTTTNTFNAETYDPDAFYCLNGSTVLHTQAMHFKNLEFVLNNYAKTNPTLLNMILLKNSDGDNVL